MKGMFLMRHVKYTVFCVPGINPGPLPSWMISPQIKMVNVKFFQNCLLMLSRATISMFKVKIFPVH